MAQALFLRSNSNDSCVRDNKKARTFSAYEFRQSNRTLLVGDAHSEVHYERLWAFVWVPSAIWKNSLATIQSSKTLRQLPAARYGDFCLR